MGLACELLCSLQQGQYISTEVKYLSACLLVRVYVHRGNNRTCVYQGTWNTDQLDTWNRTLALSASMGININ